MNHPSASPPIRVPVFVEDDYHPRPPAWPGLSAPDDPQGVCDICSAALTWGPPMDLPPAALRSVVTEQLGLRLLSVHFTYEALAANVVFASFLAWGWLQSIGRPHLQGAARLVPGLALGARGVAVGLLCHLRII